MIDRDVLREALQAASDFTFARSSGPGGQNVNKTSSKAQLRVDLIALAPILAPGQVGLLRDRLAPRLDAEGKLFLSAEDERSQLRNREEVVERALDLILAALKPRKKRVPTKPGRAAKERRLGAKKIRSGNKENRKRPDSD